VAIVGSGPAGMYLLEALHKQIAVPFAVDVIDRLPTPFGLIRSGVAPDHASVRAVTQRFEQALDRAGVRYLGGVEVGTDVSLAQLREIYDVVVLAHGCSQDKALGIPGENLPGVWGSARYTGWYNAHPDHAGLAVNTLPDTVLVIGNGNVAIDVARLLCKPEPALAATDMSPTAVAVLGHSRVRKVLLFGRRGPLDARFSVKELEELGEVAKVSVRLPPGVLLPDDAALAALPATQSSMLSALRVYEQGDAHPTHAQRDIEFQFLARPVEVLGRTQVEAVRFERMAVDGTAVRGTGSFFEIACGAVVSCIGYQARPLAALQLDPQRGGYANDEGRIEAGLYCTGWARRGPSGTIATNRIDAAQVAQRIAREVQASGSPGPAGIDLLLMHRGTPVVPLAGWRAIDHAERCRAVGAAPRRKFHSVAEMLGVLQTMPHPLGTHTRPEPALNEKPNP
jgi:NADPH-dependent glutamate synthase beta subunit-like oxidoreductase